MPTTPSRGTGGPALGMRAITPNDAADLPAGPARALLVTVGGNLSFVDSLGVQHDLPSVPAYFVLQCAVARVRSTGTTATVKAYD